ncbi:hypothetical protein [Mycobacterium sp. SMC-4]|uniref:hypothetical protein n=1 Tax=Mycobacterium sp. SMC-4 TaxID=2857059 RepID=UPI003D01CF6F
MSAGTFEVDAEDGVDKWEGDGCAGDRVAPFERAGTAARSPSEPLLTYDLTVVAADVPSVVAAAGGWLCDRVRAGWQVTVVVPAEQDLRALQIMGVRADDVTPVAQALRERSATAWAVDATVLDRDADLRREVQRALTQGRTEVTVWGASDLAAADRRFTAVRHRLSAAARAFKRHALLNCGRGGQVSPAEDFRSAALWYPVDGADLVPISAGD